MATANKRGHTAAALKHFIEYPQQHVTAEELQDVISGNRTQVQMAVNYIMKSGKLPGLKTVVNGDVWMYEAPTPENPSEVFRIVHTKLDGKLILEDGEGRMWVAKELDI